MAGYEPSGNVLKRNPSPMKDVITVDYGDDGEVSRVRVLTRLDLIYENFLNQLNDAKTEREQFETVIMAYVWSAAFLESRVNYHLRNLLELQQRSQKSRINVWEIIERQDLKHKAKYIEQLAALRIDVHQWEQALKNITEMRNRLLHYKNEPTYADRNFDKPIDPPLNPPPVANKDGSTTWTFKQVFDALHQMVPESSIFVELKTKSIESIRRPALSLGGEIERIATQSQESPKK
jgi:hypothetical protein